MLKNIMYILLLMMVSYASAMPQQNDEIPWWLAEQPEGPAPTDPAADTPLNEEPGFPDKEPPAPPAEVPEPGVVDTPSAKQPETRFDSGNKCERQPGWQCVPYYQCNDDQNIITDGSGLIDIRSGSLDDSCPSQHLDVCCRESNVHVNPPITPPFVQNACGTRNQQGVHVNIDGLEASETQFGEFPWMVAILKFEEIGVKEINLFICGGSLISYDIVLTAAHCVFPYGDNPSLKVRAGEWDTQLTTEAYKHIDNYVSEVVYNKAFDPASLKNNIALLRTREPFPHVPHISPICLPPPFLNYDHLSCFATGWGKKSFHSNFQNVMKKVPLRLVDHTVCQSALQTTRLGKFFRLDDSFICAGGETGIDTCKGDGGSPLVCTDLNFNPHAGNNDPQAESYFQIGIVAWGIGCGEGGVPGVYSDVSKMLGWVSEIRSQKKFAALF